MSRPPVPGLGRREARERAVQLVYEAEQRDLRAEPLIDEQFVVPDAYTAVLVRGTERHRARIDGLITKFATGWPLSRMPALDRAVLRIAVYELGHEPEVPTAVILNEAVEFANSYSTDDSGRFINGVLASVAVEVRPEHLGRGGRAGRDDRCARRTVGGGTRGGRWRSVSGARHLPSAACSCRAAT